MHKKIHICNYGQHMQVILVRIKGVEKNNQGMNVNVIGLTKDSECDEV